MVALPRYWTNTNGYQEHAFPARRNNFLERIFLGIEISRTWYLNIKMVSIQPLKFLLYATRQPMVTLRLDSTPECLATPLKASQCMKNIGSLYLYVMQLMFVKTSQIVSYLWSEACSACRYQQCPPERWYPTARYNNNFRKYCLACP